MSKPKDKENKEKNKETRYFIEIDLASLKLTRCGYEQRENLDKGRQLDPKTHRLFLTLGQYNKFVDRCSSELSAILDK